MKTIAATFFILLVTAVGVFTWQQQSARTLLINSENQITVYGTNHCPYTQKALQYFKEEKLPVQYNDLDDKVQTEQLHKKMLKAGLSTASYELPVLDIDGEIYQRSDLNMLINEHDKKITF